MFNLKKFYKDAIISGLKSGELTRTTASLKYVKPFLADETFDENDVAEIAEVMDEVDGGISDPETIMTEDEEAKETEKTLK